MGTGQLVLDGLVLLFGLVGVVLPGVPGPLIVWAGVLWWSMAEQTSVAWALLAGATAALLLNQALRWLLPARGMRGSGITRGTLLLAACTAGVGFIVLPVIGAAPGFLAGLYAAERVRLGAHGPAWFSTRDALRAIGFAVLVELVICLLVTSAWLAAVLFG
ncbi:DUF456 domain-containing protein [Streptomyces sp. AC563]|uniref:DUF456 domain-containing protein n=1 Tax=Streptomyces buecherae TaxID=2763006 RepID=UPI00164D0CB0|nr:DUF456 domain-containing protein [Streptomyces buecherae]MBC3992878.1 DUF456 domain-containing protein [Streptomyces buecherae]